MEAFLADPFSIVLIAVLAVLVFFMFRNSRRRRAEQDKLRTSMVPGVEVMTNFGLFGTLVAVDEDTNVAQIETSPGTVVRVHRQTLARVVEDEAAPADRAASDEVLDEGVDPAFGERADDRAVDRADDAPVVDLDGPDADRDRRAPRRDADGTGK